MPNQRRGRASNGDLGRDLNNDGALHGFEAKGERFWILVFCLVFLFACLTVLTVLDRSPNVKLSESNRSKEANLSFKTSEPVSNEVKTEKPTEKNSDVEHVVNAPFESDRGKSFEGDGVSRENGGDVETVSRDEFEGFRETLKAVGEVMKDFVHEARKTVKLDSEKPRPANANANKNKDVNANGSGSTANDTGKATSNEATSSSADALGYGTGAGKSSKRERDANANFDVESDSMPMDNGTCKGYGANQSSNSDGQGYLRSVREFALHVWRGIACVAGFIWKCCIDPFGEFIAGVDKITEFMSMYLGVTSKILGCILAFVLFNFLVMGIIRFMDLLGALWKLLKLLSFLPIFIVFRRGWGLLYGSLISMAEGLRKAEMKKEKEGMKGRLSRLEECMEKVNRDLGSSNVVEVVQNLESMNATRIVKELYDKSMGRTGQRSKKLWTKGTIGGVEFPQLLVDPGSDVNLMSEEMASIHNFPFYETSATGVRGFGAQIYSDVVGEMDILLCFGPCQKAQMTKFYVVPDCPSPVIGLPTLGKFGIKIDTELRRLKEKETGRVVCCAAAEIEIPGQKKKKKKAVGNGNDGEAGEGVTLSGRFMVSEQKN